MLQACPQLPQLLTSVVVTVQLPPQAVSPPEQAPQVLAAQVEPAVEERGDVSAALKVRL